MKRKRTVQQIVAMMMAVVLTFTLSAPAVADETVQESLYEQQEMESLEEVQLQQEIETVQEESVESTASQEEAAQDTAEQIQETVQNTEESMTTQVPEESESVQEDVTQSSEDEEFSEVPIKESEEVISAVQEETESEIETETDAETETEEESKVESTSEEDEEDLLYASGVSVTITGCTISSGTLRVTATSNTSGRLYLFDLETYEDTASFKERAALTSVVATANTAFTVSVAFKKEYLTDKFVFGVGKNGNCVSNAMYITNPEALASTSVLHTANSKKGLLLYTTPDGMEDAATLGVKHSTITVLIDHFVDPDGNINEYAIESLKYQAQTMAQRGIVVYLILVLPTYASSELRYPGSDDGPYYVAWNTGEDGAAIYEKLMKTMAEKLSGVVSHWIIGNEVNDNIQWNYMGPATITQAVQEYAKTFRLCYNAIRSVNSAARVYIPVDHRWNQNANTLEKYDTKAYLNLFDQYIQSMGNIDWCLAFHAYSIPLSAPEVWDDGSPVYAYDGTLVAGGGEVSFDENTFAISMKNIDVLTNYFCNKISRNTKGQVRTIALTEQGWTSYSQRTNDDAAKEQATSIAYAYYKAESNPYIECLIVSRQMDAYEMGNDYYKFGIRNYSWLPKYSWEVFKRLGISASLYQSAALPVITEADARCTGKLLYPTTVSSSWNGFYNATVNSNDKIALSNSATSDKVLSMQLNGYNASATPYFGVGINLHSTKVEEGKVILRVFSGEKILEATSYEVLTKKQQYFVFDLNGWSGISNITGVELWISGISAADTMAVTELNCSASSEVDWSSVIPRNFTGLMEIDGEWHYFTNGTENDTYDGLVLYNGTWYYVKSGVINWSYTGLVLHNKGWYYVQNGCVNWNYSGLTQYYGTWYYVQKGYLNWNYTNLVLYNKTWYYVQKGKINWNYTGLVLYNKTWYYVQKGAINWNYTGLVLHNKGWYYVQGGTINWNYTGLTLYYGTWYYVKNGFLTWSYTGPVVYNKSTYYVVNGKIDWSFSKIVTINGKKYTVKNGCVLGM